MAITQKTVNQVLALLGDDVDPSVVAVVRAMLANQQGPAQPAQPQGGQRASSASGQQGQRAASGQPGQGGSRQGQIAANQREMLRRYEQGLEEVVESVDEVGLPAMLSEIDAATTEFKGSFAIAVNTATASKVKTLPNSMRLALHKPGTLGLPTAGIVLYPTDGEGRACADGGDDLDGAAPEPVAVLLADALAIFRASNIVGAIQPVAYARPLSRAYSQGERKLTGDGVTFVLRSVKGISTPTFKIGPDGHNVLDKKLQPVMVAGTPFDLGSKRVFLRNELFDLLVRTQQEGNVARMYRQRFTQKSADGQATFVAPQTIADFDLFLANRAIRNKLGWMNVISLNNPRQKAVILPLLRQYLKLALWLDTKENSIVGESDDAVLALYRDRAAFNAYRDNKAASADPDAVREPGRFVRLDPTTLQPRAGRGQGSQGSQQRGWNQTRQQTRWVDSEGQTTMTGARVATATRDPLSDAFDSLDSGSDAYAEGSDDDGLGGDGLPY